MRVILVLMLVTLASCANDPKNECGDKVVLPHFSAKSGVRFLEVRLKTLLSPYRLKGAAAEIFYEGALTAQGYQGSVAEPRLTRSGGVCVPADTGSMLALSAYEQFEKIFFFDREIGVDRHLQWPRKVGVELHIRNPDGQTHNNAHYFGTSDSIGILPYSLEGLPLAFNPGVIAHEHFHAHFQSQVLNPLNTGSEVIATEGVKPTLDDLDNADLNTNAGLNRFVLRAWNEGLADFYACVFTEEPDFFSASKLDRGADRECDGQLQFFRPGEDLRPKIGDTAPVLSRELRKDMLGAAYRQGTILARLLYQVGGPNKESRRQLLHRVMTRLQYIPPLVSANLHVTVLDFEDVVPVLLQDLPLDAHVCGVLSKTLSKPEMLERFKSCRL